MRILGIETSCDDTSVAIYDENYGILANKTHNQKIHVKYGGVVPELASREHIKILGSLIYRALNQSKLKMKDIDGIAYTSGPGLVGSLIVGSTIGHSLAYALRIPVIAVNHMEGHLLSPMLENNFSIFPSVALLISGGHTQLISAKKIGDYQILGESLDDAIGEVFDKVAKFLGYDYPGGSILSSIAKNGISGKYIFPRPMLKKEGLNFSFSGLKTHVMNVVRENISYMNDQIRSDIARAFEDSVIEILMIKCNRALKKTGFKKLIVSGGVSANSSIRRTLKKMLHDLDGEVFFSKLKYCTDNGAMIAYTGSVHLRMNNYKNHDLKIFVRPDWPIDKIF